MKRLAFHLLLLAAFNVNPPHEKRRVEGVVRPVAFSRAGRTESLGPSVQFLCVTRTSYVALGAVGGELSGRKIDFISSFPIGDVTILDLATCLLL